MDEYKDSCNQEVNENTLANNEEFDMEKFTAAVQMFCNKEGDEETFENTIEYIASMISINMQNEPVRNEISEILRENQFFYILIEIIENEIDLPYADPILKCLYMISNLPNYRQSNDFEILIELAINILKNINSATIEGKIFMILYACAKQEDFHSFFDSSGFIKILNKKMRLPNFKYIMNLCKKCCMFSNYYTKEFFKIMNKIIENKRFQEQKNIYYHAMLQYSNAIGSYISRGYSELELVDQSDFLRPIINFADDFYLSELLKIMKTILLLGNERIYRHNLHLFTCNYISNILERKLSNEDAVVIFEVIDILFDKYSDTIQDYLINQKFDLFLNYIDTCYEVKLRVINIFLTMIMKLSVSTAQYYFVNIITPILHELSEDEDLINKKKLKLAILKLLQNLDETDDNYELLTEAADNIEEDDD